MRCGQVHTTWAPSATAADAAAPAVRVVQVRTGIVQSANGGALKLQRPLFSAGAPQVAETIRLGPTEIAEFAADEARPERGRLDIAVLGTDVPPPGEGFVVAGPVPDPAGTGG